MNSIGIGDIEAILVFAQIVITIIGIFLTIHLSTKAPGRMWLGILLAFFFMPWGHLYTKGAAKWIILLIVGGAILRTAIGVAAFPVVMILSVIIMALRLRKSNQDSQAVFYTSKTEKSDQAVANNNSPKETLDYTESAPMTNKEPETDEITFKCPGCQQTIEAPPDMVGTEAECPGCGHSLTVPDNASSKLKCPQCSNMIDLPAENVGQALECPACNNIVHPNTSQMLINRKGQYEEVKRRKYSRTPIFNIKYKPLVIPHKSVISLAIALIIGLSYSVSYFSYLATQFGTTEANTKAEIERAQEKISTLKKERAIIVRKTNGQKEFNFELYLFDKKLATNNFPYLTTKNKERAINAIKKSKDVDEINWVVAPGSRQAFFVVALFLLAIPSYFVLILFCFTLEWLYACFYDIFISVCRLTGKIASQSWRFLLFRIREISLAVQGKGHS